MTLLVFHVAYCHEFVNYATSVFTFYVHGSLKFFCETRNAHFIVLRLVKSHRLCCELVLFEVI